MTRLVSVFVKKSRLNSPHKIQAGVLNPDAVHGQGYYTRRVVGQNLLIVRRAVDTIRDQQISLSPK